jgi:hypothetical protein
MLAIKQRFTRFLHIMKNLTKYNFHFSFNLIMIIEGYQPPNPRGDLATIKNKVFQDYQTVLFFQEIIF